MSAKINGPLQKLMATTILRDRKAVRAGVHRPVILSIFEACLGCIIGVVLAVTLLILVNAGGMLFHLSYGGQGEVGDRFVFCSLDVAVVPITIIVSVFTMAKYPSFGLWTLLAGGTTAVVGGAVVGFLTMFNGC
jgi:hypothetical protein